MLRRPLPLLAALALVAGACGEDDGGAATAPPDTNPVASTPAATAPPADAPQPGTGPVPPPPRTTSEPDAGDEQPIRVPATFAAIDGRLEPTTVTVPPFLAIEVSVRSDDGRSHRLVVRAPRPRTLAVAAGELAVVRIAGLRAGRYAVELDGRRAATLIVGGEVGP